MSLHSTYVKGFSGIGASVLGVAAGTKSAMLAAVDTWQEQLSWVVTIVAAIAGIVVTCFMAAKLKAEKTAIDRKAKDDTELAKFARVKMQRETALAEVAVHKIQTDEAIRDQLLRERLNDERQ